ncbi:hypothetical protein Adt_29277 [Abeliophyllum distichum]|uniref:Uncharacterized protein n=1 Tax=Abeliophyllum distichum TaxID=126358 RepID=A0ABD1R7W1_9LAMI
MICESMGQASSEICHRADLVAQIWRPNPARPICPGCAPEICHRADLAPDPARLICAGSAPENCTMAQIWCARSGAPVICTLADLVRQIRRTGDLHSHRSGAAGSARHQRRSSQIFAPPARRSRRICCCDVD